MPEVTVLGPEWFLPFLGWIIFCLVFGAAGVWFVARYLKGRCRH